MMKKFTDIDPCFKEYDENKPNKEKITNSNRFYLCMYYTKTDKELKVRDRKYFKEIEKLNEWGFIKGKNYNSFRCYPCYRDINDINSLKW
jgi:hypothetical protein